MVSTNTLWFKQSKMSDPKSLGNNKPLTYDSSGSTEPVVEDVLLIFERFSGIRFHDVPL